VSFMLSVIAGAQRFAMPTSWEPTVMALAHQSASRASRRL
jgi:hypothetical protein